jgi:hypothetical protein
VAHEVSQGGSEAGVGLKFEAGNAACPWIGVAHGGHAGVQGAGVFDAILTRGRIADVRVLAKREGTSRAAQRGLRKPLDARRAQRLAGPTLANVAEARKCQGQLEHAPH